MTFSIPMDIGMFFISMLVYVVVTGGLRKLMTVDDEDFAPAVSWIIGCLLYGLTVFVMWQGR
jgi:hypothetical protein